MLKKLSLRVNKLAILVGSILKIVTLLFFGYKICHIEGSPVIKYPFRC